ncbi:MAG: CBS domain-containing protein [Anaerolineae bacterium]|nr:CBS domain-containing protein [Anaerolineae bacterium]MCK4451007.1 CBS domain-containing protein [Anaerolineae bacterium]
MDKERLVRDIYHKGVIFCKPDTPLQEVVRVMADTEVHAIMVADREGEPPVGVVSHTDAIVHYGEDLTVIQAHETMTANVISISEGAAVEEAARKLLESHVHRLLVVGEDGKPLGILSTTDIIREMRGTRWVWYLD